MCPLGGPSYNTNCETVYFQLNPHRWDVKEEEEDGDEWGFGKIEKVGIRGPGFSPHLKFDIEGGEGWKGLFPDGKLL